MHWCSCLVAWLLVVLWEIRCSEETSDGFHCGADVSLLSQFPTEKEMLFPPLTYLKPDGDEKRVTIDGATFIIIAVEPQISS